MLRKSLMVDHIYLSLLQKDRIRCKWIACIVILQCFVVFAGAISIIHCYWSPNKAYFENEKLARIMYLFDYQACGYLLDAARSLSNMRLPNDTRGGNVLPIRWTPADVTVSTRLSAKTRKYMELSIGVHCVWMLVAIVFLLITRSNENTVLLKFILICFLYTNISVVIFDMSMAIVYIAHLQQSLTKGMVVRYSGWSVNFEVKDPDEFAGWLPISASLLWLRGVIFLFWNIYCCKLIYHMRSKIKRQEIRRRVMHRTNLPIPEPNPKLAHKGSSLYYRSGEYVPEKQLYNLPINPF